MIYTANLSYTDMRAGSPPQFSEITKGGDLSEVQLTAATYARDSGLLRRDTYYWQEGTPAGTVWVLRSDGHWPGITITGREEE